MSLLGWIVVFTVLGGVLSVLGAAVFLALTSAARTRLLPTLVSFAIGALLGAAFLGLLPHALERPGASTHGVTMAVLASVLAFFLLEKLVLWRHCHADECEAHGGANVAGGRTPGATEAHAHPLELSAPHFEHARKAAAGTLILIGDGIHNLVDGILIAAAFLTDVQLGIVTSVAVIAHEIPQEIGDFAILLHGGFSMRKALLYNVLSSLTTVVGGLLAYLSFADAQQILPYVLAVAAGSFIYIAVADLIPGLHRRVEAGATAKQIVLILAGVSVIVVAGLVAD